MANPTQVIKISGHDYKITWIALSNEEGLSNFAPLTQAYGVCFNEKGEILILDQSGRDKWAIPGGTIEKGETPIETLKREMLEEVDVTLKNIKLLGVQRVDGTPPHYQVRFFAEVDKVLPQTPDPDKGKIHRRKFVPYKDINSYVRWGSTGRAIFSKAIKVYLGV